MISLGGLEVTLTSKLKKKVVPLFCLVKDHKIRLIIMAVNKNAMVKIM